MSATDTIFANAAHADARPTLSVLIPFFREDPSRLLAALDRETAALNTVAPVEVITLDDGTGDDALAKAVIETIEIMAVPTQFIRLGRNVGRSKGRNRMAANARGDWLLFLDSDMLPDSRYFLQTYLDLIRTDQPDVVCGGFSLDQAPLIRDQALHRRMALRSDCAPASVRSRETGKARLHLKSAGPRQRFPSRIVR